MAANTPNGGWGSPAGKRLRKKIAAQEKTRSQPFF